MFSYFLGMARWTFLRLSILLFLMLNLRNSNNSFLCGFFLEYFNKKSIKMPQARQRLLGQENLETYLERAFKRFKDLVYHNANLNEPDLI